MNEHRPSPRYAIPAARHDVEQVIDRSRFLCTVAPTRTVEDAQAFVRDIAHEYPDATHHCWAYVIGAPGSSDRIGLSDDGEPHGTAGRPMLTVLQHCGLGDVAAVVSRYYGGVKLGTGGLVKAYGGVVQLAVERVPRAQRVVRCDLTVRVSYAAIDTLLHLLPTFEADLIEQSYGVDVCAQLRCPEEHLAGLRRALMDATRGQVVFVTAER